MKKTIILLSIVLVGCQDNETENLRRQIHESEIKQYEQEERLDRIKELMNAGYSYENAVKVNDEIEKSVKE